MKDKELMRTIEALPAQRKLVFTLCKLEGKSYAEVSRLLQISESAVNDHISRAHRFIFQHYDRSITLMVLIFSSILINKSLKSICYSCFFKSKNECPAEGCWLFIVASVLAKK